MSSLRRSSLEPFRSSDTIARCFESVVCANEPRIAVVDADRSITFGQLNVNANGIAQLIRNNMRVDDRPVASLLSLGNPRYVDILLAATKSGYIYAGLTSDLGRADIEKRLIHSDAQLLLTDNQHVHLVTADINADLRIINLDREQVQPAENLNLDIAPSEPAFISYTSGSTGSPKGIVQTNNSVLAFINTYIDRVRITTDDRVGILRGGRGPDLLGSLLGGACVHLYDLQNRGFAGLKNWLRDSAITVLPVAPTMLRLMMSEFKGASKFPSVRLLRLSGEPLRARDVEEAARIFSPDCEVMNWLGSTEVAVASRTFRLKAKLQGVESNVGKIFDDIDVKIINDEGHEAEVGQVGEIVVQGSHLFAGYWDNPELNSVVLKTDEAGDSMFYSGDLGAFNQSGELTLLGRKDSQINFRGYRIEPEEIELVLSGQEGIEAALVTSIKVSIDDETISELAAYVEINKNSPPPVPELRRLLRRVLPLYKIPAYFVQIQRLPRLPGGKFDRKLLPAFTPRSKLDYNVLT